MIYIAYVVIKRPRHHPGVTAGDSEAVCVNKCRYCSLSFCSFIPWVERQTPPTKPRRINKRHFAHPTSSPETKRNQRTPKRHVPPIIPVFNLPLRDFLSTAVNSGLTTELLPLLNRNHQSKDSANAGTHMSAGETYGPLNIWGLSVGGAWITTL